MRKKERLSILHGTLVQQPCNNASVVLQPLRVLLEVNDHTEVVSSGQPLVSIDVPCLLGATLDPELPDMFPLIGSSLDEHGNRVALRTELSCPLENAGSLTNQYCVRRVRIAPRSETSARHETVLGGEVRRTEIIDVTAVLVELLSDN